MLLLKIGALIVRTFIGFVSIRVRVKHTESFCSGEETSTATAAESVQVEEDDGAEDTEDGGG